MGSPGGGCAPFLTFVCVIASMLSLGEVSSASVRGTSEMPNKGIPMAILTADNKYRAEDIQKLLSKVQEGKWPQNSEELRDLFSGTLLAGGNVRWDRSPRTAGLLEFLRKKPDFFKKTLPFLASVAMRLSELFPSGLPHLTREHPHKHLRRIQVVALLAASFFGIIPQDQKRRLADKGHRLKLNKLDMFHRGFFERQAKFVGLLTYFEVMQAELDVCWRDMVSRNVFTGAECSRLESCEEVTFNSKSRKVSRCDEVIGFYLRTSEAAEYEIPEGPRVSTKGAKLHEVNMNVPLRNFIVVKDMDIVKEDGALQVDFADKYVGGLSLFAEEVAQEELIFAVRPELLVTLLITDTLEDDEALVVKGAESYVLHLGYGPTFDVRDAFKPGKIPDGVHWSVHGRTPLDALARRECTVTAMDALMLQGRSQYQYREEAIQREVLKAVVGFSGDPFEDELIGRRKKAPVATGRWGCGVFGADEELKSLLQWVAASIVGRDIRYSRSYLDDAAGMQQLIDRLQTKYRTAAGLLSGIRSALGTGFDGGNLYKRLLDQ